MSDINTVILTGRCSSEEEIKFIGENATPIQEFSIATNQYKKSEKKEVASFFNCKAIGHTAEYLSQYMKKGQQVTIEGRLQKDTWEKDGKKQSKIYILVNNATLGVKKKEDN